MLKILTFLLLISGSLMADAATISKVIASFNPHLNRKTVDNYGKIIHSYSVKYDIDWKIVCAIFRQESNFDIVAVNYETRDFGIGQMNYANIKATKMNIGKLLTDADYAIHQTFLMLKDLKKHKAKDLKKNQNWYTRYHTARPSLRAKYQSILNKWFKQIDVLAKEVENE